MRKTNLLFILVILVIFVSGCLTPVIIPKIEKPIETERVFNKPFDVVWIATVNAVTQSGYLIDVAQKESGCISLSYSPVTSKEFYKTILKPKRLNCWPFRPIPVNLQVSKIDANKTKVSIKLRIQVNCVRVFRVANSGELSSSGFLEKQYLDSIESLLPTI